MITEQDLQEAIAECEGVRNPNANTCIQLASFYTIRDHLFPKAEVISTPTQSFERAPVGAESGDTEFARILSTADFQTVLRAFTEVMEAVEVLHPRLYRATLRRFFDNTGGR